MTYKKKVCHNNVNQKRMNLKSKTINILLLVLVIFPLDIFSQVVPPPIPPPPPPGLPIDGGLWLLTAGAVYFGIKRIKK